MIDVLPSLRTFSSVVLCLCISTPSFASDPQKATDASQAAAAGIKTLQSWYVPETGLYETTGWWNGANAITVLVDYSRVSGSKKFLSVLPNTLAHAQLKFEGFLNNYNDDEGWWALAWIDAYDLTQEKQYLAMADSIFADMAASWDDTCGGGIWWSKDRKYKNAIANELFLSVAAHLAVRPATEEQRSSYGTWAKKEWKWFKTSGMMNSQHLVNDGLDLATCKNNGRPMWTYNQGVLIGGLVELYRTQSSPELLEMAQAVASASITHLTDRKGILHDVCEPMCGEDGVQFKGIFVRNLMSLQASFPDERYASFVRANAKSIQVNAQGPSSQFGQVWSGPFDAGSAATQSSALDVLVADAQLSKSAGPRK